MAATRFKTRPNKQKTRPDRQKTRPDRQSRGGLGSMADAIFANCTVLDGALNERRREPSRSRRDAFLILRADVESAARLLPGAFDLCRERVPIVRVNKLRFM